MLNSISHNFVRNGENFSQRGLEALCFGNPFLISKDKRISHKISHKTHNFSQRGLEGLLYASHKVMRNGENFSQRGLEAALCRFSLLTYINIGCYSLEYLYVNKDFDRDVFSLFLNSVKKSERRSLEVISSQSLSFDFMLPVVLNSKTKIKSKVKTKIKSKVKRLVNNGEDVVYLNSKQTKKVHGDDFGPFSLKTSVTDNLTQTYGKLLSFGGEAGASCSGSGGAYAMVAYKNLTRLKTLHRSLSKTNPGVVNHG